MEAGNVSCDGGKLQTVHKTDCCITATGQFKGDNAAGMTILHIFLSQCVIFILRKSCVIYMRNLFVCVQVFCNLLALEQWRSTRSERFQTEVQKEAIHRRRNRAQITHQLGSSLSDVSFFSELLCIDNAVIGFIRLCQAVIFMAVGIPVEVTAVDNGARLPERHVRPYIWWWSG